MASISINPLTFSQRKLLVDGTNRPDAKEFTKFLNDLGQWANQIQTTLASPAILASIINGSRNLTQTLAFTSVILTPTTNQTVNTNQSALVWIRYVWSTAANFSVTLNNVVDGQILVFSLTNSSGAARTITVLANTVASSAITVVTPNSVLSSGVSVANGTAVAYCAMASAANVIYQGVGQNW